MGACFIEISTEKPAYDQGWELRQQNILKQGYATILDSMLRSMPKNKRDFFPMLRKIDKASEAYQGEDVILSPSDVRALRDEFETILKICHHEHHTYGIDANSFRKFWKGDLSEEAFQKDIFETKTLLDFGFDMKCWFRITR